MEIDHGWAAFVLTVLTFIARELRWHRKYSHSEKERERLASTFPPPGHGFPDEITPKERPKLTDTH